MLRRKWSPGEGICTSYSKRKKTDFRHSLVQLQVKSCMGAARPSLARITKSTRLRNPEIRQMSNGNTSVNPVSKVSHFSLIQGFAVWRLSNHIDTTATERQLPLQCQIALTQAPLLVSASPNAVRVSLFLAWKSPLSVSGPPLSVWGQKILVLGPPLLVWGPNGCERTRKLSLPIGGFHP